MENYLELLENIKEGKNSKEIHSFGISASEENNDFFSIISHNLKNSLSSLLGFSDLLSQDYDELNEDERKFYLTETLKSASLTTKYVERFFEWLYYKNGKVKIEPESIDLDNAINLACEKIKLKLDADNITVIKNTSAKAYADEDSLIKIFYYILENAIVHSSSKNDIVVSYSIDDSFDSIKILIKDDGKGISENQLEKIFKINENIIASSVNKNNGSGLGLILVKQLVDLNNGEISISSEQHKGTEVTIKLPLAKLN